MRIRLMDETVDILRQLQEVEYNEQFFTESGLSKNLRRELSFDHDNVSKLLDGAIEHTEEMLAALRKLKAYLDRDDSHAQTVKAIPGMLTGATR